MLSILLVEDQQEKQQAITSAICSVAGMEVDSIDVVSDAHNAKKMLKKKHYALVILDINIPPRLDKVVKEGGGLDVLSFIKLNNQAIPPDHIVGMTAYDSAFELAKSDFESLIMRLIRFDFEDHQWKVQLIETVGELVSKDVPPYINDGTTYHTDAAIVCALPEELDALLSINSDWVEQKIPHDSGRYYRLTVRSGGQYVTIVATSSPRMGMPVASAIAAKLVSTFRPRLLAMCGICAGVRGKVDLGDILIADPCFDWGGGKWIADQASGGPRFLPAAYQWRLDQNLRSKLLDFGCQPGMLEAMSEEYKGSKPLNTPKLFIEAMASGGSVVQVKALVDEVREQHKNLVGLEMESYAVFTAAEYADNPKPICVSVKAVCDYGDEEKSDSYHGYASSVSAQYLYGFILSYFGGQ